MKTQRISNFHELHEVLSEYRKDNRWMFRGQSNPEWKLLPKAGRKRYAISDDKKMFEAWQRRATEFVNPKPNNDWEWLAIAQHHGLSTRLLDWTYQLLIAAFFSVWDKIDSNRDSYLYCFKSYLTRASFKESPFSVKTISKYKPHGMGFANKPVEQTACR